MTVIATATPPVIDAQAASTQPTCHETVRKLVASLSPRRSSIERRGDRRFPFSHLIRLTSIDDSQDAPSLTVIGKHLSEAGLGFYHQTPLPYRRVHVWLGSPVGVEVQMIMDLTWCRFVGQGWYVSGGRFVETVSG